MIDRSRVIVLLQRWTRFAERWWYDIPGSDQLGCFATGYNSWGVQTNQKYVAAQAILAVETSLTQQDRDWALQRALSSLRFSLESHRSGSITCTDGNKWGHTWISALGIERMMHGLHAIREHLTDLDRQNIKRLIESECDWLTTSYRRSAHVGVQADKWNHTGKNDPESNLWNGCLLWRGATMYADHPRAADWREMSLRFLANGVSIAADANDSTMYDGKPLRDRHIGASFFDSYALDHHGYLNVGYMIICVSQAAMLHFDYRLAELPTPELLHLHQRDLWQTVRKMTFDNGRLARIGGDSRVRYAYCQEYLIPSLMYASDQFDETTCETKIKGILDFIETEAAANVDGSFYGKRLDELARLNPYYYIRIEGDRASALSMALAYAPVVKPSHQAAENPPITIWSDDEHGAVLHKSATRFASFSWRAHGIGQGLCVPPDASDLAEWDQNLTGEVDFYHQPPSVWQHTAASRRKLISHRLTNFDGGFVTSGVLAEGVNTHLSEGWSSPELARHFIGFVALPDGHTVVGIQVVRTGTVRSLVRSVKGMKLNVPNDVQNRQVRKIETVSRSWQLQTNVGANLMDLQSRWITIDGKLSAIALTGAATLALDRSSRKRGGIVPNLTVDQICAGHRIGRPWLADPHTLLLDCAWMVSTVDSDHAKKLADSNINATITQPNPLVRVLYVMDVAGKAYTIAFNVSEAAQRTEINGQLLEMEAAELRMIE